MYRLIRVPAPASDPAFTRHTGLPAQQRELPPALLPISIGKGIYPIRNDDLLWIDLKIPADAAPGDYAAAVELARDGKAKPAAATPIIVHVYDFVLPSTKNLHLAGELDWSALTAAYPDAFDIAQPWLISRTGARGLDSLEILDAVMEIGRANRVAVHVPRVQPVVKLPPGQPPTVLWSDYDSVVTPWMADRDYFELPRFDGYDRLDPATRAAYWREVAGHFDRNDWLPRAALVDDPGASVSSSSSLAPALRILTVATTQPAANVLPRGPLFVSDATQPQFDPSWLAADTVTVSEGDVRGLAFLAATRHAPVVRVGSVFATAEPGPADQTVWFYPGKRFDSDRPVLESVALKWARRAQQDYEYVHLARQRGQAAAADLLARLAARPLAAAGDSVEWPLTRMMAGTVNPDAWPEVQKLLARLIESSEPGRRPADAAAAERLELDQARWLDPQEQPLLAATETRWSRNGDTLTLDLRGLVAQSRRSHDSAGAFGILRAPGGWQPGDLTAAPPVSGRVTRERTSATVSIDAPHDPASRPVVELQFIDGYTRRPSVARVVIPVAGIPYRPAAITVDGALGEWAREDLLHDGPLTAFLSRPAVQAGEAPEGPGAQLFAAWDDRVLHLAFHIKDFTPSPGRTIKSSVDYRDGRVWGEDVVQFLVQPVYTDGSVGPLLHVACKPSAQWVETLADDGAWRPAPQADVAYAASTRDNTWSGELAVPLPFLRSTNNREIALLRFNFARHIPTPAQSASFAGPVDSFRDSALTAALLLRK